MSGRMRRVDEVLRQVVSESVSSLEDPGVGFVTITAVRTSPDLRMATVFVSVLGSEDERAQSLEALERSRVSIQERVNNELRMKRTPVLSFEYDQMMESSERLSKLIDELDVEIHDERID